MFSASRPSEQHRLKNPHVASTTLGSSASHFGNQLVLKVVVLMQVAEGEKQQQKCDVDTIHHVAPQTTRVPGPEPVAGPQLSRQKPHFCAGAARGGAVPGFTASPLCVGLSLGPVRRSCASPSSPNPCLTHGMCPSLSTFPCLGLGDRSSFSVRGFPLQGPAATRNRFDIACAGNSAGHRPKNPGTASTCTACRSTPASTRSTERCSAVLHGIEQGQRDGTRLCPVDAASSSLGPL